MGGQSCETVEGWRPSLCWLNSSSAVPTANGSSVISGECRTDNYFGANHGAACDSSSVQGSFQCQGQDPVTAADTGLTFWTAGGRGLQCAAPGASTGVPVAMCVAAAGQYAGSPCAYDAECGTGDLGGCDLDAGQCAQLLPGSACAADTDCESGFWCAGTAAGGGGAGTCTPRLGAGAVCPMPFSAAFPVAACEAGYFCHGNDATDGQGMCVARNTLPAGTVVTAMAGGLYPLLACASGVADAVIDVRTGAPAYMCRDAVDPASFVGTPCPCPEGDSPVTPGPAGSGTVCGCATDGDCMLMPLLPYGQAAVAAAWKLYSECAADAKAPNGHACPDHDVNGPAYGAGLVALHSCSYYTCMGEVAAVTAAAAAWAPDFARWRAGLQSCEAGSVTNAAQYVANDPAAMCQLPAAWAEKGWLCNVNFVPGSGGAPAGGHGVSGGGIAAIVICLGLAGGAGFVLYKRVAKPRGYSLPAGVASSLSPSVLERLRAALPSRSPMPAHVTTSAVAAGGSSFYTPLVGAGGEGGQP
jgi:hypothetical protein